MSDSPTTDEASPDEPIPDEASSDDQPTAGGDEPTVPAATPARGSDGPVADVDRVLRVLVWGGVGLLALLAAVATFRVYTSASRAISRFVAPEFQPAFEATFNLAVLLLALAGIGLLLRRLEATA